MPPCPTDHEPHPDAAPHVHPPLWREFLDAAWTYLFAGMAFAILAFALGVSCGAAALGYRLVSEVAR